MGVFGPNLGPLIPKLMFRNGYDSIGFGAVFEPEPIEVNDSSFPCKHEKLTSVDSKNGPDFHPLVDA